MKADSKIIIALDFPNAKAALVLINQLQPELCRLKVGKELFTIAGPDFVRVLVDKGFDVFLDLKYHDIPSTVEKACAAAAKLGVWMLNVHALGGSKMMQAARAGVDGINSEIKLIAVTLLTSMGENDLPEIGLTGSAQNNVIRLASLAKSCSMDGVVCSAQEAPLLRQTCGRDFCLVTPGIRPEGSEQGDQTRTLTPAKAIVAGSDYLVIGRPITQAEDPVAVLEKIHAELGGSGFRA
tara:strand:- start:85 stop:798 length:714 start_codon:yes stop_codon:yes gene_type:complete